MEKSLFLQMQYAILSVLRAKNSLSEEEFRLLTHSLRENIQEKTHERK